MLRNVSNKKCTTPEPGRGVLLILARRVPSYHSLLRGCCARIVQDPENPKYHTSAPLNLNTITLAIQYGALGVIVTHLPEM